MNNLVILSILKRRLCFLYPFKVLLYDPKSKIFYYDFMDEFGNLKNYRPTYKLYSVRGEFLNKIHKTR